MQASFFLEFHNLKDVSFFQVLFNKITAASEGLLVAVKEVRSASSEAESQLSA